MNKRIVSNTGPIIALSSVNHLEILDKLFSSVSIPEAVHKEILDGGASNAGIKSYNEASWIHEQIVSIRKEQAGVQSGPQAGSQPGIIRRKKAAPNPGAYRTRKGYHPEKNATGR